MITTRISVLSWFDSPLMSARYSSPLRNDLSSAKLFLFFMVHSFPTADQNSIAGSRLWLRPVGIPYINTLPSFEDRYGPIFNQRIYVIIFHFLSKIISFIIYLEFIPLFFTFKMVSFWEQKNSENTLRIQSCYYISLQKSPIVASISSIGKKSRDVFTPRPNGIKSLPVTQTG